MSYSGLGGNKFVQIGKYNIPRTLVRSLILFFLVISGLVNAGLSIIGYADGIGTVLYSLSITSVYVFATLVYITMLLKTNEIVKLYEYMENMIVQSKCIKRSYNILMQVWWELQESTRRSSVSLVG